MKEEYIIRLTEEEKDIVEQALYFAKAEYSTDNAVGTAYLAHLAHKEA